MIAEAIETLSAIARTAGRSDDLEHSIVKIGDRSFRKEGGMLVDLEYKQDQLVEKNKAPKEISFCGLDGFAAYVNDFDKDESAFVKVGAQYAGLRATRGYDGKAVILAITRTKLEEVNNRLMRFDELLTQIRTRIAPGGDLERLIEDLSSLTCGTATSVKHHGLGLLVVIEHKSVSTKKQVVPIYDLHPYLTFAELSEDLPPKSYLLSIEPVKDGLPNFKLESADGGRWEVLAATAVAEYLREKIDRIPVLG